MSNPQFKLGQDGEFPAILRTRDSKLVAHIVDRKIQVVSTAPYYRKPEVVADLFQVAGDLVDREEEKKEEAKPAAPEKKPAEAKKPAPKPQKCHQCGTMHEAGTNCPKCFKEKEEAPEAETPADCCETCKFFKRVNDAKGHCRRYPPTTTPRGTGVAVSKTAWCGEFKNMDG